MKELNYAAIQRALKEVRSQTANRKTIVEDPRDGDVETMRTEAVFEAMHNLMIELVHKESGIGEMVAKYYVTIHEKMYEIIKESTERDDEHKDWVERRVFLSMAMNSLIAMVETICTYARAREIDQEEGSLVN